MPTTYAGPIGAKITYEGSAGADVWAQQPVPGGSWELRIGDGIPIYLTATTSAIRRLVRHIGELQDAATPAPTPLVVKALHSLNPDHTSRKWRAQDGSLYEYLPNKPYGTGYGSEVRGFWVNNGFTWGGTDPSFVGPFTEILK